MTDNQRFYITRSGVLREGRLQVETPELPDGEVIVHIDASQQMGIQWPHGIGKARATPGRKVLALIEQGVIDTSGWRQMEGDTAEWVEKMRRTERSAENE